jgi:hypothetical protein
MTGAQGRLRRARGRAAAAGDEELEDSRPAREGTALFDNSSFNGPRLAARRRMGMT